MRKFTARLKALERRLSVWDPADSVPDLCVCVVSAGKMTEREPSKKAAEDYLARHPRKPGERPRAIIANLDGTVTCGP